MRETMTDNSLSRQFRIVLTMLVTTAMVLVPVEKAAAQTRADSLAVVRATLILVTDSATFYARKYAALVDAKAAGTKDFIISKGDPKIGVESRVLNRQGPVGRPRWLPNARAAGLHAEVLAGTKATTAAPVESLPKSCMPMLRRNEIREYCRFRDYDTVVAFSLPEFNGNRASVWLLSYSNPVQAGDSMSQSLGIYELERINNQWKVVSYRPLFIT
jgi:hypothetical protein